MKLEIRDGVVIVLEATVDEAVQFATRFGEVTAHSPAKSNGAGELATPAAASKVQVSPATVKVMTANKGEALLRFYQEITIDDHKKMLRVLAGAGNMGLDQDQLRKKADIIQGLAGFGNAITKRTKGYGLTKADILTVEKKGTVGAKRYRVYRLSPDMLAVMREHGFVESGSK